MDETIDKNTPLYTISTAAELLGLTVHTLRKYEKEGLILPFKKTSRHRLYSQNDLDRLKCIQNAIRDKKFSIPAIKTMYALIPCWSIVGCSEEDRKDCGAFNTHEQPCWMFKHKKNLCARLKCRDCDVYNQFSTCENIKNGIKQFTEKNY